MKKRNLTAIILSTAMLAGCGSSTSSSATKTYRFAADQDITTMDSASEWFSRSIVDALSARGYQVSYAQSTTEAIKGKPAYLLTGTLNELKINEKSATSFDTSITAKYTLADRNKKISMETLNASQTKTGLPGNSTVENLLRDTLTDVVNPMAEKVAAKIGR